MSSQKQIHHIHIIQACLFLAYLFSNLRDKFGYDTWILSFRGNDELNLDYKLIEMQITAIDLLQCGIAAYYV